MKIDEPRYLVEDVRYLLMKLRMPFKVLEGGQISIDHRDLYELLDSYTSDEADLDLNEFPPIGYDGSPITNFS